MANTCTYHDLIADAALRVNSLVGASTSTLETSFTTRPLTTAEFQSTIFPFSAHITAILYAEQRLAQVIAETGNHPYRTFLQTQTSTLATGANLPSLDSTGKPIIGIYGAVLDGSVTTITCTEGTLEQIRRYNQLATAGSTLYLMSPYQYKIDGNTIEHTQTTVIIKVCAYDYATQLTAATNDTVILLPDALGEAYVTGSLAYLLRDDEFMAQGNVFRGMFEATLAGIRQGLTSVPPVSTAGPTMAVSAT